MTHTENHYQAKLAHLYVYSLLVPVVDRHLQLIKAPYAISRRTVKVTLDLTTMKMVEVYLGSCDGERALRWLVSNLFVNLDELQVKEHLL